jgi:hypothetical protein
LLLVAVFPANIYMAVAHVRFPGVMGESWIHARRARTISAEVPILREIMRHGWLGRSPDGVWRWSKNSA